MEDHTKSTKQQLKVIGFYKKIKFLTAWRWVYPHHLSGYFLIALEQDGEQTNTLKASMNYIQQGDVTLQNICS